LTSEKIHCISRTNIAIEETGQRKKERLNEYKNKRKKCFGRKKYGQVRSPFLRGSLNSEWNPRISSEMDL
jgi:hypothetical protein